MVVEVINGRDKVVEELMGEKAVREWKEDKGEGEKLEKGSFSFCGR